MSKLIGVNLNQHALKAGALAGLAGVKQCDALIKTVTAGEAVDIDFANLQKLPEREAPVQESSLQV